jgi:microcystin-dependent protein
MSGQTVPGGLPFPDRADTPDVSKWIEALAIAVDRRVDAAIAIAASDLASQALVMGGIPPVGTVVPFAGIDVPTGGVWELCAGKTLPVFPDPDHPAMADPLFAVIGRAYGGDVGAKTFMLPNLKGKMVVGQDGTPEFKIVGTATGDRTVIDPNLPNHAHGATVHGNGNHRHSHLRSYLQDKSQANFQGGGSKRGSDHAEPTHTGYDGTHDHPITVNSTTGGGNTHHNNMQPSVTMNYIIKIKAGV